MQDQHQTFENTLKFQYQKKIEEIKEPKEKYEHAKEKQMEMERIYDELKVRYQKETKNSQQHTFQLSSFERETPVLRGCLLSSRLISKLSILRETSATF